MTARPGILAFALALALASSGGCSEGESAFDVPLDPETGLRINSLPPLPAVPDWADNPATPEAKLLGQTLFFDLRLSGSGNSRCATCHAPPDFHSATVADTPDRQFPNLEPALHRHTPSLQNIVFAPMMRWDGGHFTDLYDMMVLPLAEANMNIAKLPPEAGEEIDIPSAQAALYDKVTVEIPGYVAMFRDAFGVEITEQSQEEVWRLAGKAMAVYIRVVTTHGAPFDAWNEGDDSAIGDDAKRGALLFAGKAGCTVCHSGPLLSDFLFHNVSTELPGPDGNRDDEGRFLVTGVEVDRGAFLTPTLRGASLTSPYLHDGTVHGLRKIIRHFSEGGATADPQHSPLAEVVPVLTDAEIDDLVAFLKALDGPPLDPADVTFPPAFPE